MAILNELLMSELAKLQESAKVGTGDYYAIEPDAAGCGMGGGGPCFGHCKKICANTIR